jgi:hypothetical protein
MFAFSQNFPGKMDSAAFCCSSPVLHLSLLLQHCQLVMGSYGQNLGIWPAVKKNPLTFDHFNICTWQSLQARLEKNS